MMKESDASQFPDRLTVQLPEPQGGRPVVFSFVPIATATVTETVGVVPSDANAAKSVGDAANASDAESKWPALAKSVDLAEDALMRMFEMADVRPRITRDGAGGTVRFGLMVDENQQALINAVLRAAGFKLPMEDSSKAARFLDVANGAEASA